MPWVLLAVGPRAEAPRELALAGGLAVAFALQVLAGSADLCAMTLALAAALVALRYAERRRRIRWRAALALRGGRVALAAALTCALWWPAAEVVSRSARRDLPEDVRGAWSIPALGLARLVAPLDPARVPFEPERSGRGSTTGPSTRSCSRCTSACRRSGSSPRRSRRPRGAGARSASPSSPCWPWSSRWGRTARCTGPSPPPCRLLRIFRYPSKALWAASLAIGARRRARRPRAATARAGLDGWRSRPACSFASCGVGSPRAASRPAYRGAAPRRSPARSCWRLPGGVCPRLARLRAHDARARRPDDGAPRPERDGAARLLTEPPRARRAASASGRRSPRARLGLPEACREPPSGCSGRRDPYGRGAWPARPRSARARVRGAATAPDRGDAQLLRSRDELRPRQPRSLRERPERPQLLPARVEGTLVHKRLLQMGAVAKVDRDSRAAASRTCGSNAQLPSLTGDPIRVLRGSRSAAACVARRRGARSADEAAPSRLSSTRASTRARRRSSPRGCALDRASRASGTARWLARRADRQQLETDELGARLLVLADAYDPGWRASIDGAPAVAVVRANLAFRGVPVSGRPPPRGARVPAAPGAGRARGLERRTRRRRRAARRVAPSTAGVGPSAATARVAESRARPRVAKATPHAAAAGRSRGGRYDSARLDGRPPAGEDLAVTGRVERSGPPSTRATQPAAHASRTASVRGVLGLHRELEPARAALRALTGPAPRAQSGRARRAAGRR